MPLPPILKCIGKMHSQTHIEECQYCFSLYYALFVGRTDGEEVERFWSEANQAAGSTKQMNPGHHMDSLDAIMNNWNRAKQLNYGMFSLQTLINQLSLTYHQRIYLQRNFRMHDIGCRSWGRNLTKLMRQGG